MQSPFPGMDPYLEHPALWPDVHNRLIAALADDLSERVAPRYYVGLERRTYLLKADDLVFGGRPDLALAPTSDIPPFAPQQAAPSVLVLEVDVPVPDEVSENFLEIHEVKPGTLVTIVELLSAANKLHRQGREEYERKRGDVFRSRTSLVEIDLLRAGEPMPVIGPLVKSDYRILVSRGIQRPRAALMAFTLRQPIPSFTLPLLPGDDEPEVELNRILHDLYRRARFDLRLDYTRPPVPPLPEDDAVWAQALIEASGLGR
ncbi:MAG TPA: DUF4058 family protein [Alphaproteobacteria bacterium]|nr:DUF4058 family protein [Alphaproteobacteria bacterium]